MSDRSDDIANVVLAKFDGLPLKAKPHVLPDGRREWTVLCGLVVSTQGEAGEERLDCVSLGTGVKCLPQVKLPLAQGACLHDWHAEVVTMRAFNRFLLDECAKLVADSAYESSVVCARHPCETTADESQPFAIRKGVRLLMFCSEAPCGDASMESTMDAQTESTPWELPTEAKSADSPLEGRAYFSQLGVVRRKPARADAPVTLSKSCSDKLALRQCTSLLSSIASILIHPSNAYLHQLVLPASRYSQQALDRAFGVQGRMAAIEQKQHEWRGGYRLSHFEYTSTAREFAFCRPLIKGGPTCSTSNVAAVWTPTRSEVVVGGSIQGHKQFSPRGASMISRLRLWKTAYEIASSLGIPIIRESLRLDQQYRKLKAGSMLRPRHEVKDCARTAALRKWPLNAGDDDFMAT